MDVYYNAHMPYHALFRVLPANTLPNPSHAFMPFYCTVYFTSHCCELYRNISPSRTTTTRSSTTHNGHYLFSYFYTGLCIGVTWLVTVGGGGSKSTMDIRNFNLRKSQVRKMGKIGFNQSLIYYDLRQRAQRIYSASHPL
jgi:hypothetical protein